jgi:hypothetical protein
VSEASKFEEVINHLGVSSYHCRTKNLLVVIVDASLDVLNVDGHDPDETFVVNTWIWYAKDLGPLYVMSLPSGLCFKVCTSSWLGHSQSTHCPISARGALAESGRKNNVSALDTSVWE